MKNDSDHKHLLLFIAILCASPGIIMLFLSNGREDSFGMLPFIDILISAILIVIHFYNLSRSTSDIAIPHKIKSDNEAIFSRGSILKPSEKLPAFSGAIFDIFDDNEKIHHHTHYLATVKAQIDGSMTACDRRFTVDGQRLHTQQQVLFQLAQRGAEIIRKLEANFPRIKADLAAVPTGQRIALPLPPKIPTVKDPKKSANAFPAAFSRAMVQGGQAGGVTGVIATAVVGTAISIVMIQKQIRKTTELHEKLVTYAREAELDHKKVRVVRAEQIRLSDDVYEKSVKIAELLRWCQAQREQGKFRAGAQWDQEEVDKLLVLKQYSMLAPATATEVI